MGWKETGDRNKVHMNYGQMIQKKEVSKHETATENEQNDVIKDEKVCETEKEQTILDKQETLLSEEILNDVKADKIAQKDEEKVSEQSTEKGDCQTNEEAYSPLSKYRNHAMLFAFLIIILAVISKQLLVKS